MTQKNLAPQQSLQIINEMIERARRNRKVSYRPFLVFGWTAVLTLVAVGTGYMVHPGFAWYTLLWLLFAVPLLFRRYLDFDSISSQPYLERAVSIVWVLAYAMGLMLMVNTLFRSPNMALVLLVIEVCFAFVPLVVGTLLNRQWVLVAGIAGFVAITQSIGNNGLLGSDAPFLYFMAALTMAIILLWPGYTLRAEHNKQEGSGS